MCSSVKTNTHLRKSQLTMKGKGLKNQIGHTLVCLMTLGPILQQRTRSVQILEQDNMNHLGRVVQLTTQNLAQLSGLGNAKIGGAMYWARTNCERMGLAEMRGMRTKKGPRLLICPPLNMGLLCYSPLLIWI